MQRVTQREDVWSANSASFLSCAALISSMHRGWAVLQKPWREQGPQLALWSTSSIRRIHPYHSVSCQIRSCPIPPRSRVAHKIQEVSWCPAQSASLPGFGAVDKSSEKENGKWTGSRLEFLESRTGPDWEDPFSPHCILWHLAQLAFWYLYNYI